jgi:hypothetical protein
MRTAALSSLISSLFLFLSLPLPLSPSPPLPLRASRVRAAITRSPCFPPAAAPALVDARELRAGREVGEQAALFGAPGIRNRAGTDRVGRL